MAIRAKLTTAESSVPASPAAKPAAVNTGTAKPKREISEEEKATRKDRVQKAKDALSRSATLKGDWVPPARAAIKTYLQRLNEPNQPDDAVFEALIEAPFKAPPKKRTNDRRG